MIRQNQSCSIQAGCLHQQVVVILGAGIGQGRRDAGGMGGNRRRKSSDSLASALGRFSEDLKSKGQRDQAQGDFLG